MLNLGFTLSEYNEKDLNELAKTHRFAFKDHYNSRLGNIYAKAFLKWFGNNPDAVFVEASDKKKKKVYGYICGAKYGYGSKMNKDLMPVIVLSFLTHPWIVFDKRFFKMFIPKLKVIFSGSAASADINAGLNKPVFSAVGWAVDPTAPKEVPGALYEEFLNRVKELGFRSVRGSVFKKNKLALVYYIHNKWSILKSGSVSETITIYKNL